jgi:hypothetical protein
MNEIIRAQLKVLAANSVRPVRCGAARKRAMRDELFTHLIETFERELSQGDEESAALERTAARFGSPAELTASLQASIPIYSRLKWFIDYAWSRDGESWVVRAVRQALIGQMLLLLLLGMPWLLAGAPRIHHAIIPHLIEQLTAFFIVFLAITALSEWVARLIRRRGQFRWNTILQTLAGASLVVVPFLYWFEWSERIPGGIVRADFVGGALFLSVWRESRPNAGARTNNGRTSPRPDNSGAIPCMT